MNYLLVGLCEFSYDFRKQKYKLENTYVIKVTLIRLHNFRSDKI